jgi:hypothetical protein
MIIIMAREVIADPDFMVNLIHEYFVRAEKYCMFVFIAILHGAITSATFSVSYPNDSSPELLSL